jgi:hypothetical protein
VRLATGRHRELALPGSVRPGPVWLVGFAGDEGLLIKEVYSIQVYLFRVHPFQVYPIRQQKNQVHPFRVYLIAACVPDSAIDQNNALVDWVPG